MKKFVLFIISISLISIVVVGCSKGKELEGKWIEDGKLFMDNNDQSTLIYFKKGNKFELKRSGTTYAEGKYEIKGDNEVIMKGSKYAMNGMYDETKATLKGEGDKKKLKVHYDGGDETLRMAKGNEKD